MKLPGNSPADPRLNAECAGKHYPIHQPWRQLCRVIGFECFVGGEDGEGEGSYRTVRGISVSYSGTSTARKQRRDAARKWALPEKLGQ